jgi:hypothetical protein
MRYGTFIRMRISGDVHSCDALSATEWGSYQAHPKRGLALNAVAAGSPIAAMASRPAAKSMAIFATRTPYQ